MNKELDMDFHIFRSLPFISDSRVSRVADLIGDENEKKHIYTWESDETSEKSNQYCSCMLRVFPFNKDNRKFSGLKYILFLFWIPIQIIKGCSRGDVCVFMDFETIVLGYFAARFKGLKVVFDIVDPFAQTKIGNPRISLVVDRLELGYANISDLVVLPHKCRNDYYLDRIDRKIGNKKIFILENVPSFSMEAVGSVIDDKFFKNHSIKQLGKITIGYFGTLDDNTRGLEWLKEFCVQFRNEINLVIAGRGTLSNYFSGHSNIYVYGAFKHSDLSLLYDVIDFTWAYYSPDILLHRYAAPNKYYEHLMFGKPIITSDVVPQASDIKLFETGVFVDCRNDSADTLYKNIVKYNSQPQVDFEGIWEETYHGYYERLIGDFNNFIKDN